MCVIRVNIKNDFKNWVKLLTGEKFKQIINERKY